MLRKWLVVPRGEVASNIAMAQAQGIGEIEERDGIAGPFVASENVAEIVARNWKAEWKAALTVADKMKILAERLELE